jgi:lipid-binding SYLF domain-containing protein
MICPRIFKAGFFFGGSGGGCVLLARAGNGTWSYPAFYGIGSGSFGLQIGIQDSQLMMMIMTNRGLNAVMDSQFKLGADASIALATVGAGVEGATTAAVGADIVAFALNRGVFGGISLQGSIMSSRTAWNAAYYGQPFAARQIVVNMQGSNPGADPLREILTRYGAAAGPVPAAAPPPPGPPPSEPGYAPAYPPYRGPAYPQQQPQGQYQGPATSSGYQPAYPSGYQGGQPEAAGDGRGPIQQQQLAPGR